MRNNVKVLQANGIYLDGKHYRVGELLQGEELAQYFAQGRKALYVKSFDVYGYAEIDGKKTFSVYGISGAVFPSFRKQYDILQAGAYKLIPNWFGGNSQ
ncbi:Uncharacterized protein B5E38_5000 [Bacillus cereus]|nr:Uncharacterized protein B5E38_5000 [Bacillus cereus]ARO65086.1 Uncharacterized protein B5E39_2715 [Bacillus cereus]